MQKHSVLHQGHSGRTATHIKLRLKWLVSEGYTVIALLFPKTQNAYIYCAFGAFIPLVLLRIHMHSVSILVSAIRIKSFDINI